MNQGFQVHDLEWNSEKITRFWSYESERADNFFTRMVGRALFEYVQRQVSVKSPVLDLGCGPGYLTQILLENGFETMAVDLSLTGLIELQERLGRSDMLKGVSVGSSSQIPARDGSFGSVFFIEMIEHLLPHEIARTLQEIHR